MLIILSPAKTFQKQEENELFPYRPLLFHDKTIGLIHLLQGYDSTQLSKLMKLSTTLSELNVQRYQHFQVKEARGTLAIDAFGGEVYKSLQATTLGEKERAYLSRQLLILSGLYGCIHPMDAIQPYRLEMATRFSETPFKTLYTYWKERVTCYIQKRLAEDEGEKVLINLASTEYAKVVDMKAIATEYRVVTVYFKEQQADGRYKVVGMYAKKARGMLVRYMAQQNVQNVEALKRYCGEGYVYQEELSSDKELIFVRTKSRVV